MSKKKTKALVKTKAPPAPPARPRPPGEVLLGLLTTRWPGVGFLVEATRVTPSLYHRMFTSAKPFMLVHVRYQAPAATPVDYGEMAQLVATHVHSSAKWKISRVVLP